jgi:hypothetical protein
MADTSFDDFDSGPPPEESNNRTFVIVAGILGGIILISVACLAGVYLLGFRGTTSQPSAEDLTITAQANSAFINQALTATQAAIQPTATTTFTPTSTLVVAIASSTSTPDPALGGTQSPITATVAAALTQAAAAQLTIVPTSTALPNTGFADEFGLPGMFVMALAFIIVILLARRLRTVAPSGR